jgi:hypothetical protein
MRLLIGSAAGWVDKDVRGLSDLAGCPYSARRLQSPEPSAAIGAGRWCRQYGISSVGSFGSSFATVRVRMTARDRAVVNVTLLSSASLARFPLFAVV